MCWIYIIGSVLSILTIIIGLAVFFQIMTDENIKTEIVSFCVSGGLVLLSIAILIFNIIDNSNNTHYYNPSDLIESEQYIIYDCNMFFNPNYQEYIQKVDNLYKESNDNYMWCCNSYIKSLYSKIQKHRIRCQMTGGNNMYLEKKEN